MTRQKQVRGLQAESLENRNLMAGDVTANVQGGILYLHGDAAANGVLVQQSGAKLEVVGTKVGGEATTINGSANFVASGVTLGVTATLGKGNDVVRLANGSGPVAIPGAVVVETGEGNDSVSGRINNSGAVTVNLGPGVDTVFLGPSSLGTLVINSDPLLASGAGADAVTLNGVKAVRAAVVRMGAGNDTVKVSGASAFPASLTITTDDGNDHVSIVGTASVPTTVGGALTINTGRGNDAVFAQYVTVNGAATITNFAGNSTVTLNHLKAVDGLFAYLGSGDDALAINDSSSPLAVLGGGLGSNTLTLQHDSFGRLVRFGF